jgi:hypothetical protein
MNPEPEVRSGRPADRSLRALERRLEDSFRALADDLSVGRGFVETRSGEPRDVRASEKGQREPKRA